MLITVLAKSGFRQDIGCLVIIKFPRLKEINFKNFLSTKKIWGKHAINMGYHQNESPIPKEKKLYKTSPAYIIEKTNQVTSTQQLPWPEKTVLQG